MIAERLSTFRPNESDRLGAGPECSAKSEQTPVHLHSHAKVRFQISSHVKTIDHHKRLVLRDRQRFLERQVAREQTGHVDGFQPSCILAYFMGGSSNGCEDPARD